MLGGVHYFVNSPSSSTDAAIVGSLMAVIVFLLLSLFIMIAITTALVMTLRAKQKQCTCKGESIIYMNACMAYIYMTHNIHACMHAWYKTHNIIFQVYSA